MASDLSLLGGFQASDTILWQDMQPRSAAWFCHAASALAARLPPARFALNLCESQAGFLLASAAAVIARRTLILPPSRLPAAIAELRARHADSLCLVDSMSVAPHGECVAVTIEPDSTTAWPPPLIPATHTAAILFTSGSTGEPQPQPKRWCDLVRGAQTFVDSLGQPNRGSAIVGTVAPQHMFGFETTVMLPLHAGTPVLSLRPAYPADLRGALDTAARLGIDGVWLMTTPLQLRAFHRELPVAARVQRVVTSTMPLEPALAQAVERDWEVPVHEIYGCTEGGMLATRRAAVESHFTPGSGLAFDVGQDGSAQVSGAHVATPLALQDRIRLVNGGFELAGRDNDIVKVAGKRASLAALTRHVLAIDGVRDAAVFLPRPDAARVAAVVVAPALSALDLRRELARRIDPAFMPRPLVLCASMPRGENGKLPHAALCDAINAPARHAAAADAEPPSVLARHCMVAADHPALAGHFPAHPIVPGVVLLQMIESMLAESGYRVSQCAEVKFRAPVTPDVRIDLRVALNGDGLARFTASTAAGPAMTGTFVCARARRVVD